MGSVTSYARTDLACESKLEGYTEFVRDGVRVTALTVDQAAGKRSSRAPGRYVTVECGQVRLWDNARAETVTEILAEELKSFTERLCGKAVTKETKLLVCGLGNRHITPDALGPSVADKVTVTRHVTGNGGLFDALGCSRVAAIQPGVLGQTGIEAADIIRGAAESVRPDVIIAVDALAARSCARLASTVQISDSGIQPGSGIGNRRTAITKDSVGFPVIALGVPTVVDSSTLVYDALEEGGVSEISPTLREVLENGRRFFVSPKESDVLVEEMSTLLAAAIDRCFGAEFKSS